jgi:hypothetical protein
MISQGNAGDDLTTRAVGGTATACRGFPRIGTAISPIKQQQRQKLSGVLQLQRALSLLYPKDVSVQPAKSRYQSEEIRGKQLLLQFPHSPIEIR